MKKENPFGHESSDDSPGFLLWRTHNYWQRELRRCLKEFDLTHTQFVVLATTHYLNMNQDEVTQIEIADHAQIDVMLTSNVLRALETRKLIERGQHSSDTRAKTVYLTESGYKLLKPAVKQVEDFDNQFFSKIEDIKKFNENLRKLSES